MTSILVQKLSQHESQRVLNWAPYYITYTSMIKFLVPAVIHSMIYADDKIIYHTGLAPNLAANKVQNQILRLNEYFKKRCLTFYLVKTEMICFRPPVTAITGRRGFIERCAALRKNNGFSSASKLLLYKEVIRPIITYGWPFILSDSTQINWSNKKKVLRVCTGIYKKDD